MKTLIKYLLFAILFVASSCGERVVGLGDDELVTISEESLNYNVIGGHISIANCSKKDTTVLVGATIQVVAVPESGYEFIGWFVGNSEEPVSTNATFKFAASRDVTIVAKFAKIFAVSVQSAGNGSVAIKDIQDKTLEQLIGCDVTVVATPAVNCDFLGWFVGDAETPVSTDATYTFTVKESVALVAKFSKWPLVSISSGGNGTVSFENYSELSQYVQSGSELTIIANPDADCDFLGWFIGDAETPVSTELTYTFIVKVRVALVAKFYKPFDPNGYDYVDLGLPSGTKWAAYNVGATKPEEFGGYYAWGETEEKSNYAWSTYKWCNGSSSTMTKYCTNSNYGTVDNKTVLELEDDVAHVKWGGDWRMPTEEEQDELRNKCSWEWTSLNFVNGYRVTGPNGNSIFLPAAGCRNGTGVIIGGSYGYYWSSSLVCDDSSHVYYLDFSDKYYDWYDNFRYYGLSVRPVCK